MPTLTETVVEQAALAWLQELGYDNRFGPEIAPNAPGAERNDDAQVVAGELRVPDAEWIVGRAV